MKLTRFGPVGEEKPGLIDSQGGLRDLSQVVSDISAANLSEELLRQLEALDPLTLPRVAATERLGPPVGGIGKFIAIGLNYSDHAAEAKMPVPAEPVVFMKATSCIVGARDPILLPRGSLKTDWEVELGIVMGSAARYVPVADALSYVAGYVLVNDVSERAFQLERGGQWDKGKGCDSFGPIGPWLVTRSEIKDVQALKLWLRVNGVQMQRGSTSTMIFSCAYIVSYLSQFMALLPGDVITTGTPPGVGMGRKPPVYLKPGDVVTLGISGLGEQRQEVRGQ
jgi:2,4-didehydro-3-deoxy-L-rhamnonate hydrolase